MIETSPNTFIAIGRKKSWIGVGWLYGVAVIGRGPANRLKTIEVDSGIVVLTLVYVNP